MKYTEEEKKAIKEIKNFIFELRNFGITSKDSLYVKYSEFLLKLVEKQQKEIKELKSKTQIISPLYIKENYIPKEAIRKKIKEIQIELDKKYSAEKISIFSGNTYMEKFKLLGRIYALKEILGE